jgi:omega-6 fatty acid desaturase (delta-12 desaturase)
MAIDQLPTDPRPTSAGVSAARAAKHQPDAAAAAPAAATADAAIDLRQMARHVAAFRQPDDVRGGFELAVSGIPLIALWLLMWLALDVHYALTLLLAIPAAGFLLRLFLIQHDCGHGAFFKGRRTNDWVGRCIGVLTLSPYDFWRRTHAMHHASTGNLDRRGIGDVDTLTVREYAELGRWARIGYRLYRHPVVMFGVGPAYLFFLRYRLPLGLMRVGWRPWASTMATNGAIAALAAVLILMVGVRAFLLIQLPITLIAASIGVWLFYVQHQFEFTLWKKHQEWDFKEAALYGSSHYVLPRVIRWFTANIGVHHVHHLCSTIPFYRLPAVLRALPELENVNRLTFRRSLATVKLVLWDEDDGRLLSFREARARRIANA